MEHIILLAVCFAIGASDWRAQPPQDQWTAPFMAIKQAAIYFAFFEGLYWVGSLMIEQVPL